MTGLVSITRPTVPLNTAPQWANWDGDILLLSIAIFPAMPMLRIGFGPVFVAPTCKAADEDSELTILSDACAEGA